MVGKKYVEDCGGLKPVIIPQTKKKADGTEKKPAAKKKQVKRK